MKYGSSEVALSDLDVFLEACETPVDLVNKKEGYSVLLDFTLLKTEMGRPKIVYRFYNEEKLERKIAEKRGLYKELKKIVKEAYEQEMPDLNIEIKVPGERADYLDYMKKELLNLKIDYEVSSRTGGFWGRLAGVLGIAAGVDFLYSAVQTKDVITGAFSPFFFLLGAGFIRNDLSYNANKRKAEIARGIKIGVFDSNTRTRMDDSELKRSEDVFWYEWGLSDPCDGIF